MQYVVAWRPIVDFSTMINVIYMYNIWKHFLLSTLLIHSIQTKRKPADADWLTTGIGTGV